MEDLQTDEDHWKWTLISAGVHSFVVLHKPCRFNVASVTEETFIVNELGVKNHKFDMQRLTVKWQL